MPSTFHKRAVKIIMTSTTEDQQLVRRLLTWSPEFWAETAGASAL